MRIPIFLLLLFSGRLLSAQETVPYPDVLESKPCELMVYNTRELTSFAYNTHCKTESYPFLTPDGQHLYYTAQQSYQWIFYTHRNSPGSVWSVPVPVQIAAPAPAAIRSCCLSSDKSKMFLCTDEGLFVCEAIEGSMFQFSSPVKVDVLTPGRGPADAVSPFSQVSFSPDGSEMYAYTTDEEKSMAVFTRSGETTFTFREIISKTRNEMGSLSPDGLLYYFTNDVHENHLYCRKRSALGQAFSDDVWLVRAFEPQLSLGHARVAADGRSLAMILSNKQWDLNDVYFYELSAGDSGRPYRFTEAELSGESEEISPVLPVMVPEKEAPKPLKKTELLDQDGDGIARIEIGTAFPNPAKDHFFIYYNISGKDAGNESAFLRLLDQSGRQVYSRKLDCMRGEVKISPEQIPSGVYYVRIDYNGLSSVLSRITLSF